MSEQSAKPYLVRAICEWCADNGLTPYLAVKVNAQTRVPAAFVKNGEIVLNISTSATRQAHDRQRLGPVLGALLRHVAGSRRADDARSSGIFAKETGYGFAFTIAQDPAASLASATAPQDQDIDAALERDLQDARDAKDGGKGKPRPSHLQIIK